MSSSAIGTTAAKPPERNRSVLRDDSNHETVGPERQVIDHFDAVSEFYYQIVDAYRTDLGYYHRRELEASEKWVAIMRPQATLDAGCGPGRHSLQIVSRGYDVVSLDVSRGMLSHLVKEAAGSSGPSSICPIQGDIKRLPLPSNFFDLVVCMEVIEHFPEYPNDFRKAARELARVIKPGGVLILEFPLRYHSLLRRLPRSTVSWSQVVRAEWRSSAVPALTYQRRFSRASVERITEQVGFHVVERTFVRVIPSGYVDWFPGLENVDRLIEKIPVVNACAREAVLVLRKSGTLSAEPSQTIRESP